MRLIFIFLIALTAYAVTSQNASAQQQHLFKIASIAPEGSVWVESFKKFAAEVNQKTGGTVAFRIYPGGVMGDDRAMYRKMMVGQLHGGGFTMTGVSDIVADFRVMAIPFLFNSYDEVDFITAKLVPMFSKRFSEKGLQFIAMTEVGFIYTFSNQPRTTIADLQKAKIWAPSNDPLTAAFLMSLNISPITLGIPDVLSSLQTGLVDTVFNSLYGSIVLQWFTKAPVVTDKPYGYAYGVFILDQKSFSRLNESEKKAITESAAVYFGDLITKTRQSNEESRAVLEKQGVSFVQTTDDVVKDLEKHRDLAIANLVGQAFSAEIYDTLATALAQYRQQGKYAAP